VHALSGVDGPLPNHATELAYCRIVDCGGHVTRAERSLRPSPRSTGYPGQRRHGRGARPIRAARHGLVDHAQMPPSRTRIRAGKHVLVEKPSPQGFDARRWWHWHRIPGLVLSVISQHRYDAVVTAVDVDRRGLRHADPASVVRRAIATGLLLDYWHALARARAAPR